MRKGLLVMEKEFMDLVYPNHIQHELQASVEFVNPPVTAGDVLADLSILREVEVLFSGWGWSSF